MTVTAAPSAPAPGPATDEPRSPRRWRSRLADVLAVLAVAAIVAGVIGWQATARSALGAVSVTYDAQPVECDGADVGLRPADDGETFLVPVVPLQAGLECRLRVQVVNESAMSVDLESMTIAAFGELSALDMSVGVLQPTGIEFDASDVDAVATLSDEVIGPGTTTTYVVGFTNGGDALMDECAAMGTVLPTAVVSALGVTEALRPASTQMTWFLQGSPADCD
ncbi:hypothetical protein [Microbacterium hominis]|uniref:Uncharacterized protein n=1 Tax=Microbacterium hominis TaxID=162426 RepID=A0A7D4QDG9_9MICO|nr:hypothetical protein [Microbacterium hominis]QKJ20197.1 hypothetical protein HQM25_13050 [Microbacterium hominis]